MSEITFWDRVRWLIGRLGYEIVFWSERVTYELCPEGQRLWDEWDSKKMSLDYWPLPERATAANAAWVNYLDHRAACKECPALPTHKVIKP